nr:TIGR03862 family flavoprotein [Paracoccus salsus]
MVIGAGPAGLMAAEMLAAAGRHVVLAEAMPTPARKFLMAGKSGLNLTKDEPCQQFARHFSVGPGDPPEAGGCFERDCLDFGPAEVMAWARGLGIALFTGSTGRVFPVGMKASPLLRAWLARLRESGVALRPRWRWVAIEDGFRFETPAGTRLLKPRVTVLALGGASWPRLGSDAGWVPVLRKAGVAIADFRPANMGLRVEWSSPMARYFGHAVKGVAIRAGGLVSRGEWVISRHGIEGGGLYQVSAAIRDGASAQVDLTPDLDLAALSARFARPKGRLSVGNWLRRVLGDPVKVALLLEWGRPLPDAPEDWAARAKALELRHDGPAGLERAISSAGGIAWSAVTRDLELLALPGVFAAGEMLDWEAPTGGYLLTGCLATGRRAGLAAARHGAAWRGS